MQLILKTTALGCAAAFFSCGCADKDTWRLVFSDDFGRAEPGAEWIALDGDWKIENRCLVCAHGGSVIVNRDIPLCQKLEFEALTDMPGDISPFLQTDGRDMFSGYFLQFGGFNNTMNKARRLSEFITFDRQHLIEKGKWHRIAAEFDGKNARLTVDGHVVHDYLEAEAQLLGSGHNRAGIFVHQQARIRNVRVYARAPGKALLPKTAAALPESDPLTGNLLRGGDGEDPALFVKWGGPVTRTTSDAHSGAAALRIDTIAMATAPGQVEINRSNRYELSCWFRSANTNQVSRALLDMRFFTVDRRPIDNWAVQPATTASALLQNAPAGSVILRVAKRAWQAEAGGMLRPGHVGLRLAVNARDDLSDLPNFETLPVDNLAENESWCEVTLAAPLKHELPAGTGVRLHRYLDYPRVATNHVPAAWTRYAFTIAAQPAPGTRSEMRIWPGAKYAGVVIFNHYSRYPAPLPGGEEEPILHFDDLTLKKVDAAP